MKTVLLVEDEQFLRALIARILEFNNFIVKQSVDGADALIILNNQHVDIVLCDIMMPNIDGFELLKIMKSDGNFKIIPFIFLSAMVSPDDVKRGLRLGANDFLKKPIDVNECITCLNKFL